MSFFYFAPSDAPSPPAPEEYEYQRPSDWLPIDDPTADGVVALFAVFEGTVNPLAFTIGSACDVDFGNGVQASFPAGRVQYDYNYADIPADTLCSRGYKQVVVRITPTTGMFNSFRLMSHTSYPSSSYRTYGWLDVRARGPLLTNFGIGHTDSLNRVAGMVERVRLLGPNLITTWGGAFYGCRALEDVLIDDMSKAQHMIATFHSCHNLRKITLPDTPLLENPSSCFYSCKSLAETPIMNLSKATTTNAMFYDCASLLKSIAYDLAKVINAGSMFLGCDALIEVAALNLPLATDISNLYSGCASLKRAGNIYAPAAILASSLFSGCYSLQEGPSVTFALVQDVGSLYNGCQNCVKIPALDLSTASSTSNTFGGCESLRKLDAFGSKIALTLTRMLLSATELNKVFTNLGTANGARTITITGTPGALTCDRSIAVAKGYTVVG